MKIKPATYRLRWQADQTRYKSDLSFPFIILRQQAEAEIVFMEPWNNFVHRKQYKAKKFTILVME